MSTSQHIITILMVVLATMLTRFLPFILFPADKKTPDFIQYLGKTLPYAAVGLLVIYCIKDVSFTSYPFGLYEFVSIFVVAILHIWKRNMFISIAGGSILYMFFVQML